MSGYASRAEVEQVIKDTLRMEGKDPADYSIRRIVDGAFYYRGPGYGWGLQQHDEPSWRRVVAGARKQRVRHRPNP